MTNVQDPSRFAVAAAPVAACGAVAADDPVEEREEPKDEESED